MTAKSASLFQQEFKSCRVAIIGMSCLFPLASDLSEFWQNRFQVNGKESFSSANQNSYSNEYSFLLKAADAALDDAGISEDFRAQKRTSIVLGHHANPMPGLKLAVDQFSEQDNLDLVLLLIADIENNSGNFNCLGALVLKRLEKAIEDNDRIYASPILIHEQQNDQGLTSLKALYKEKKVQPESIGLLTMGVTSSTVEFDSTAEDFSQWFGEDKSQSIGAADFVPPWCSIRSCAVSNAGGEINGFALLLETILTLQQRILLPSMPSGAQSTKKANLRQSPFYINASPRPWFHHQIPRQFAQMEMPPVDQSSLRRAALHVVDGKHNFYHLVLEECQDMSEPKRRDLKPDWQSEVFTLFADNRQQLVHNVQRIREYLLATPYADLKDLAFTINSWTKNQIDQALANNKSLSSNSFSGPQKAIRIAIICTSVDDFQITLEHIIADSQPLVENIYSNNDSLVAQDIAGGKLAFVLPGLGAAYPNMLADMCLHFPEVRAIFDFVDHLATLSGNKVMPSDRIFPRQYMDGKSSVETPASLAVMDSAVVTVLLAEWALFNVLLNLGITPDVLLGCSTGEFAVLTMSGAIDILKAAPAFYHLSTGVSQSLPIERLINLRSLKINAAFEDIEQQLIHHQGKIHLSADLSIRQLIVTGDRDSINVLAKSLEENSISADFLPFAIPYHTSLVAGVVSDENPEVQELQIDNPLIESWSCSLAKEYPATPSQIRKITTELFSKPILFRKSIEALYAKGVRKFIEVGPRGNLAPVISETLAARPHVSLAANRSDLSALTQLNHVLATLFVNDLYMDLSYLYQRRSPIFLPIFDNLNKVVFKNTEAKDAESKNSEIKKIDAENLEQDQLLASFQSRLSQLQENVISAIKSETSKKQSSVAVMERSADIERQQDTYLSQPISLSEIFQHSELDDRTLNDITCRLMQEAQLPDDDAGLSRKAEHVLSSIEIKVFQSFRQFPKRRQWLAGRITLKETVRDLLYKTDSSILTNADIEIDSLESGKIYVNKINTNKISANKINANPHYPLISLSHKDGYVIAVAADSARYKGIGIDLESTDMTDESLAELILSAEEQKHIQHLSGMAKNIALKKIWAAKESVAKSLGLGLPAVLKNLSIVACDESMNQFSVQVLIQEDNNKTTQQNAYVAGLENMILALSYLPN